MQTLIATFDDTTAARRACERLQAMGLDREQVHLQDGSTGTADAGRNSSSRQPGHEEGVLESIGNFFTNLVESHADQAANHGDALRRGGAVVAVDAQDAAQGECAAEVLRECGALTIDEHARQRHAGQAAGSAAAAGSDGRAVMEGRAQGPGAGSFSGTGAPLGTHSFTGAGNTLGMPVPDGGLAGRGSVAEPGAGGALREHAAAQAGGAAPDAPADAGRANDSSRSERY